MKVYEVIMEDWKSAYKVFVPAVNEKAARKFVEGNGDIVKVKEADIWLDAGKVRTALINEGFGDIEADIVMRLVEMLDN